MQATNESHVEVEETFVTSLLPPPIYHFLVAASIGQPRTHVPSNECLEQQPGIDGTRTAFVARPGFPAAGGL